MNDTTAVVQRRGVLYWLSRAGIGIFVTLAALIGSAMLYERVSAGGDAERFPAPGQIVRVNSRGMHLNCTGAGDITVILEAGANVHSDTWAVVQPELSAITRTCSYDRAGYGWSDPDAHEATPERMAQNLHALLNAARVQPPYILVGHSSGGRITRLFTALYPDEVAGLVFIDARHESMEPTDRTPEQTIADREAFESSLNLYRTLRTAGIARLFGLSLGRAVDPSLAHYPDDVAYRLVMFAARESTLQTMMAESRGSTANDDQLRAAVLPIGLPVYVLTADSSLENDGWEAGQAQLAALSANSAWDVVANSSHNIHADQPHAILNGVRRVYEAIQNGTTLAEGAS